MNANTMNRIIKSTRHAREKHPDFAVNLHHAVSIAAEEFGEFAKAVNEMKPEQIEAEALDTIAVFVRIIERDYLPKSTMPQEQKKMLADEKFCYGNAPADPVVTPWTAAETLFDNDAAMKIYKEDMLKRINELLKEEDKALRSQLKLICETHHISPLDVELCYQMLPEGHKMWFRIKDGKGDKK